jgi:hypothetical protein
MLDKLLKQYVEKFEDNFPIFYLRHLDEKEITDLIKKAIEKNEPYIPEYHEDGSY